MFCGQCGNKISDNAKFCTKCGCKVETVAEPEANIANIPGTSEVKAQKPETSDKPSDKPKKKSKLWLWILLIVLVFGLGATAAVLYINNNESVKDDDEDDDERDDDEDDDEEDDDKDSDSDDEDSLGGYGKYVDKSEKTATVQMIWSTMDALEILAADPEMDWEIGEVVYVKFTEDGMECGSGKEEIISQLKAIMGDNVLVKQWFGFELWAKKTENDWVEFATSWDYDEMAEIYPSFADRFSMTSVEP